MTDPSNRNQIGWAKCMLRAAKRCTTKEDQEDLFRFILNPDDTFDICEPTFMSVDTTDDTIIQKFQSMKIGDDEKKEDIEFENVIDHNGATCYIKTVPLGCT